MTTLAKSLTKRYVEWLQSRMVAADINGTMEITTPFLDRHNDRLQIYVVAQEGGFRLTDDGYILNDLASSGCSLESKSRKSMLKTIVNGFGVLIDEDELFVETSEADFPRKKHSLIQAMLAVNDLFFVSRSSVANLFLEDVRKFLSQAEVSFSQGVSFTGKSGFLHKFDYLITPTRKQPERLLKAINHPSRETVTPLLFAWDDTKNYRPEESRLYAILNDTEKPVPSDVLTSLQEYQIKALFWSKRENYTTELAT